MICILFYDLWMFNLSHFNDLIAVTTVISHTCKTQQWSTLTLLDYVVQDCMWIAKFMRVMPLTIDLLDCITNCVCDLFNCQSIYNPCLPIMLFKCYSMMIYDIIMIIEGRESVFVFLYFISQFFWLIVYHWGQRLFFEINWMMNRICFLTVFVLVNIILCNGLSYVWFFNDIL